MRWTSQIAHEDVAGLVPWCHVYTMPARRPQRLVRVCSEMKDVSTLGGVTRRLSVSLPREAAPPRVGVRLMVDLHPNIHIHLDKRLYDGLFHWFASKHVTNVARTAIESAFSAPQLGIRDRYRVVPQPRSPSANTAGEPQRAHTFQARLRTVPWGRRAVATKAAVPPRPPLPVPQRALVAPMTCILSVGQGRVLGHGAPSL